MSNNKIIIKTLVDSLHRYNALYRLGKSEIPDAEYDHIVERLRALDPSNEWFNHIEPGYVDAGRKCKLPIPMKSLNKVKGINDIKNWLDSTSVSSDDYIVVMPKFDGISILNDENTGMAYTRGGAENEGQDVSEHFKKIYRPIKRNQLMVYGELMFTRIAWKNYFEGNRSRETGDLYKSPRNTIAGLINRDTPCDELALAYYYRYGVDEESLKGYKDFDELMLNICHLYHQPISHIKIKASELNETMLYDLFENWSKTFYIDGLVLYVNDIRKWEMLGRHSGTGNPRYAIAYKHPDFTNVFETTVLGVDWRISKSGALKPVVKIEQVDAGDCIMENPTGYNYRWIIDNEIGPGAKILVTRSGGVIPKILKSLKRGGVDVPSRCPHCHKPLTVVSAELMCVNKQCPGITLAEMIFFFKTAGVENVGDETYIKFFNAGFNSIGKMLDIQFDDIVNIDGFGDSVANTILSEMNKLKKDGLTVETYIHASNCFKGIGKAKATQILGGFNQETLNAFISGKWDKKLPVYSITNQSFIDGYDRFMELVYSLPIKIVLPENTKASSDQYKDWKVCFSGVRNQKAEELIKGGSGNVVSGVSKNTTHLVVKDKDGASSKITKARSLGISIYTLEEFMGILG